MTALAVIGWAFIAGLAIAAFLLPIYLLDSCFKGRAK